MWYWHNGEWLSADEVRVPIHDHGFLYGMGLFETFRTFDGVPFLYDWHWERLAKSLDALWIDMPYTKEDIRHAVDGAYERNGRTDLYIRLNVSAGEAPLGLYDGRYDRPNVTLIVKPLARELIPQGRKLEAIPFIRSRPEAAFRLKSHHYMNNLLAKRQVRDRQAEGLFANELGHVVEGLVSNVFWIEANQLYTTPLESGALAGVTRRWMMETFSVQERHITFLELREASEILLTNSIQQIAPVLSYEGKAFPGTNGSVFQHCFTTLCETIGQEGQLG